MLNGITEGHWERIVLSQTRSTRRGLVTLTINGKERLSQKMAMAESDVMTGGRVSVCSEGFVVGIALRADL